MVVGDDQVDAQLAGQGRLLDAADPAIHGDQQIGLIGGQRADGFGVQPVAFVDAMGDVVADFGAEQFQAQPENRRAGHAVDVVVAVDGDPPSGADRGVDPLGGQRAAGQQFGIAEGRKLGIEKVAGGGRVGHAAADQQLGHHRRDARGVLQGRDTGRIVRVDAPALGHDELSVVSGSVVSWSGQIEEPTTDD